MRGQVANESHCQPAAEGAPWVEIGRVARPHGLAGGLVVLALGDDPEHLLEAERLRLAGPTGSRDFDVRSSSEIPGSRARGPRVRMRLEGIDSRERAEAWFGAAVSIPEERLHALPEGEFYWRDLLGLRCRTLDGRELGRVEEIWPTGSNDVLVVRDTEGTLLVPALHSVLVRVDLQEESVWVELPPELLESA